MTEAKRSELGATVGRRGLLIGAGAAGVAAVAATRWVAPAAPVDVAAAAAAPLVAEERLGYRLTPHVLRYYQTAKV